MQEVARPSTFMNIHIISVGKLKEEYLLAAEKEYLKRLQPYSKIEIHEIREESFTDKDPVDFIKEKEGKKILEKLEDLKGLVVVLEEKGKQFISEKFAEQINKWKESYGDIIFVLGGPLGLSPEVVSRSQFSLSLSPLTFTHQMARIILLEQIYRAEMINHGRKYHY